MSRMIYLCCRASSVGRGDILQEGIKLTRQLIRRRQRRIQVIRDGPDYRRKQQRYSHKAISKLHSTHHRPHVAHLRFEKRKKKAGF